MLLEIGQVLDGKYKIVRLIGQGGMGAVYEGLHAFIDRRVAIKILLPSSDSTASARFEQEARAAGRIGSDHILEILDIGTGADGSKYMVAEFLDGEPLADRIVSRGRLSALELAPIATQLLAGLSAAHRAGIVHRDLKPDNIFLLREKAGHQDFVKIIDFGISKFSQIDNDGLSMTKTGMLVGTPYYMSPEQARGKGGVDARADIYAVGVILYEALAGQVPFTAESFNDLLFKVVLETPTALDVLVPGIDPAFVQIVNKGMAREPSDRYQTADEFIAALQEWSTAAGAIQPRTTVGPVPAPSLGTRSLSSPDLGKTLVGQTGTENPVPRIPTRETPGAFGSTGQFGGSADSEPRLWWQKPVVWAGAAAAVVGLGALIFVASSDDESEAPTPAIASVQAEAPVSPPEQPVAPEIVSAAAVASAVASAPASPAEPAPSVEPAKKVTPSTTTPKEPSTAPKKAATVAPASSGSTQPAKKKFYYGY